MRRLAVATQEETYERMREPLAERGIEVVPVQSSERTVHLTDSPFPDVDVGFVFPPRIMEGGVADALLSVPWVNDREAVLRSRNKADVLARLSAADVPVPETVMASNPVDEEGPRGRLPTVRRARRRQAQLDDAGTGIAKAHDLDSFLGVVDYLDLVHDYRATADRSFLVQEFLPDARDVRAMVVDGDVVGAVERRLPEDAVADGQWKHNVHRGAAAEGHLSTASCGTWPSRPPTSSVSTTSASTCS